MRLVLRQEAKERDHLQLAQEMEKASWKTIQITMRMNVRNLNDIEVDHVPSPEVLVLTSQFFPPLPVFAAPNP